MRMLVDRVPLAVGGSGSPWLFGPTQVYIPKGISQLNNWCRLSTTVWLKLNCTAVLCGILSGIKNQSGPWGSTTHMRNANWIFTAFTFYRKITCNLARVCIMGEGPMHTVRCPAFSTPLGILLSLYTAGKVSGKVCMSSLFWRPIKSNLQMLCKTSCNQTKKTSVEIDSR